ncbi:hypothetical protein DPMN_165448 [Dreissena polymorpha]|uniref:Uncharacterized protein n=1 Tax=Dreissena polymorpha TaxID=45954 RepID=A0A9D4IT93_DREPO|nr:hypothetical protein DPMN_165448 [Dreissena polymorpha]
MCELSTEYSVERRKSHRGDSPIEPETGESLDSALLDSDNDGSVATVGYSGRLMRVLMFSLFTICCSIGITSF